MPAGQYSVLRIGGTMISLRGGKAIGTLAILPAYDKEACRTSKLVFDKVGNQYFLRQIFSSGSTDHSEVSMSKAEKLALKATIRRKPRSPLPRPR